MVYLALIRYLSLSARRAWIEIQPLWPSYRCTVDVALRKESVDRNMPRKNLVNSIGLSLSARRAWIEIVKLFRQNYECFKVALRKESVDRN